MIKTDFDESIPLISHQAKGEISLSDILRSMEEVSSLHTHYDAAVLWDLRGLPFRQSPDEFESGVPRLIEFMKKRMSAQKRAVIVNETRQKVIVERIIGAATAPWPWAVFTNYEDAMEWVRS